MGETFLSVVDSKNLQTLFGACDRNARMIRDALEVRISARDGRVHVEGEEQAVAEATEVLEHLRRLASRQGHLEEDDVTRCLAEIRQGKSFSDVPAIEVFGGRRVRPRTPGQARYIRALTDHSLVFCTGPAGTGKTYLAVAVAVAALKAERIRKIVLVRPAVEAGESLGYLPGDLQAKINPYLRPLFDALHEMMEYEMMQRYREEDLIEMIPLAYMRGRTLSNAFIILDEAQNTTVAQMKMFLTRMGSGSTIVVSGDTTQIDLPKHMKSGLVDGLVRLRGIDGFASISLSRGDIVRHRLVQDIVDAYEGPTKSTKKRSSSG